MKVTGKTPDNVKKICIQGSQDFSTFHFDDSQGPPKDGIWFHVGVSSAADAAGSSVARETAVSFSPPPQRVPPRPPNNHRKRKECVAELGDDDDDFVGVPPRPPIADSSKDTRVDARKTKKSKSSLAGPNRSEGVQNPSKRTSPNYRSAPNKVIEAINVLIDQQKVMIRDYPFDPLLDLKLKGLENTKLLVFLMDSLDPDTLTLDLGNGKPLKITRHSIQCVLGLPNRGERIVAPDRLKQKEALSNLKHKLGIEPHVDVKVQDLITWLKKGDADPFSVRCYFMILLAKLLVPGTSDFITGKEAALTEDMAKMCSINWASVIFDDIAMAAKIWRSKKKGSTHPSMHGCLMFLLVYYLDNLMGEHSTVPLLTPRVAHITKQQLLDLIEQDKRVVNGVEKFGALPLRSQVGTCYMEDPPESADIPSTSHSLPYASFPSMLHHLVGLLNRFSPDEQLAAKDALCRCDEQVRNLSMQISSAQFAAINKIKSILSDAQSRTNHPPPPDGRAPTNAVSTPSLLQATRTAPNMEAARERQPTSSHVADDPNVMLHDGRNIGVHINVTDPISYTQVIEGDGFNKLSSSQQDVSQSAYNSPHDSPHEVLTNGVCKTCHDLDEMCHIDEELHNEEGDADPSATDEATLKVGNESFGLRPQVDAGAARQMASPRTPQNFPQYSNIVPDPTFPGLHSESSPLPPPVFDKSPNLHHDSLTPSVDGTELVTQSWEVSQQLRDAGIQKMGTWNKNLQHPYLSSLVYDKTPKHGSDKGESV